MREFGNGLIGLAKFDAIELGYKAAVNLFVGFYVDCVFKLSKLCNFYVLPLSSDWIGMIQHMMTNHYSSNGSQIRNNQLLTK